MVAFALQHSGELYHQMYSHLIQWEVGAYKQDVDKFEKAAKAGTFPYCYQYIDAWFSYFNNNLYSETAITFSTLLHIHLTCEVSREGMIIQLIWNSKAQKG